MGNIPQPGGVWDYGGERGRSWYAAGGASRYRADRMHTGSPLHGETLHARSFGHSVPHLTPYFAKVQQAIGHTVNAIGSASGIRQKVGQPVKTASTGPKSRKQAFGRIPQVKTPALDDDLPV